jgi:hypothetical protein
MNILGLIDLALDAPPSVLLTRCGEYYSSYYALMRLLAYRSSLCVELGVEKGRGVLSFASAKPDVRVVGIDSVKRPELDAVLNEYKNIEFLLQPSIPAVDLGQPIDVLHIDTEHSYSMAREEFKAWQPYLADEAVVLFDDLNAMEGGVNDAFQELQHFKIREDRLHPVCGYGVLIYER